jgi:hypothetical protein
MDPARFDSAHDPQVARNAEAGFPERRVAIPVAVLAALEARIRNAERARPAGTTRRAAPPSKPVALPRLLSKWGVCSRKDAEARVKEGRVAVDGRVIRDVLSSVSPVRSRITVDGRAVSDGDGSSRPRVVRDEQAARRRHDHERSGRTTDGDGSLPEGAPKGVMPVGRLDADSAGLLILTERSRGGGRASSRSDAPRRKNVSREDPRHARRRRVRTASRDVAQTTD